ncbi:hypothetical protein [Escherichia albertii]|nr:hypothetical protein [Escherichia albertii]
MSRFDFATGRVIIGFTLQCCDLAVITIFSCSRTLCEVVNKNWQLVSSE